jgi:hypothetical protein
MVGPTQAARANATLLTMHEFVFQGMRAFHCHAADRGLPRVVNRPADAAIEARLSDDRGLLVDGRVSIFDMFSATSRTPSCDEPGQPDRRVRTGRADGCPHEP